MLLRLSLITMAAMARTESDQSLSQLPSREALNVERLRHELVDKGPCSFVDVVEETGSTNSDLAARITGKPKEGLAFGALLSEHQTSGKGRMGRSFTAPPRSQLIVSVVLVPGVSNVERVGTLSLAAGLALVDSLGPDSGATLKWPNDLLINDKKMSGILAEGVDFGTDDPAVIMGIGLNVSLDESELPVPHASSLSLQGIDCDRTELAIAVITNLADRVEQWRTDHAQMIDDYKKACATLGEQVRVHLPGEKILQGVVTDINEEGHVVVREESTGTLHELAVGDVVHLRMRHQWHY